MTNWEKYKDIIIKYSSAGGFAVVDGEVRSCLKADCTDCEIEKVGVDCDQLRLEWLDEEYKEPSPYEDWEIDDPIEVSSNGRDWCKAHFAGVNENGLPLSWGSHGTSWSCGNNDSRKIWWNYARKVEE